MSRKRKRPGLLKWLIILLAVIALLLIIFRICTRIETPEVDHSDYRYPERVEMGKDHYACEESWLKKNRFGLWEMYLQGNSYELGIKNGILASEQIHFQEEAFVASIREMLPSDRYLRFLRGVIIWMNRNLDNHIPEEYQQEIFGVAQQASDTFSFIGPPYLRILNYHAAHDIGHALQNMNLVACTAFSLKGSRTSDGKLLVGRNFDFSLGDEFARNKIVAFYDPEAGHRFACITWGGMIGVVSGMNDQGLAVALNAAKSGIPSSSKTPVSILARQILQYASNIDEAWNLASQSETFVAESFLISSAKDNKTVVIEKRPDEMALYDPDGEQLVLTNHFQSETFKNSKITLQNKEEGASLYRWERTRELLDRSERHDLTTFATILRDQRGLGDTDIGMGNEKAVNQLIAHHSVIFKPGELRMWVSAFPYSLGTYVCYDLDSVFGDRPGIPEETFLEAMNIAESPFLSDDRFSDFLSYREETKRIKILLEKEQPDDMDETELENYLGLNPGYYYPYYLAGEWYYQTGNTEMADRMYNRCLDLEIPRSVDRDQVLEAKQRNRDE